MTDFTGRSTSLVAAPGQAEIARADGVNVTFPVRQGTFKRRLRLHAVRDVSFGIRPQQTYGLVGESGSGKSTTGRALLRLVDLDSGSVSVAGQDITGLTSRQLRPLRRHMQMVFQDPYSSLAPSAMIADVIGEPLRVHERLTASERAERVGDLLTRVGLPATSATRYPYEFSGGQRQRIAIARAIALHPHLIVLDEAVSALDVSTQNQILKLLEQLREDLGIAYLFISHNLSVVRWLADRTAVMYLGGIVEEGPTEQIYSEPQHPYTRSLLSAVPVANPVIQRSRPRTILTADAPDPLNPPSGCSFRTRCPQAMAICAEVAPERTRLGEDGWVACHLHG
ncbi:MAG: ABC transporter ATP-binding protein [Ilumatobacteraceae bacterium]